MTKQEALQKIEELRKFVDELDKQQLEHGDLVYLGTQSEGRRIVVDTEHIRDGAKRYVLLNKEGKQKNSFAKQPYTNYIKIKNVFRDQ